MVINMDKIIKDNKGRIVYMELEDGFREYTKYDDKNNIKIVETHYTNGIIETEKFINGKLGMGK